MLLPLTSKIFFVDVPNNGRFPYCYCMLIRDNINAIIDTSCGEQQAREIAAQGLDLVINSHFHEDHIMFNWIFDRAQIWAHTIDAPGIRSKETWLKLFGFKDFGEEEIGRNFVDQVQSKDSPVHRELHDQELIDLGTVRIRVIHAPGHTKGHCAFFEENEEILFSGDILLNSFGPWYGHANSSIDEYITSIKRCRQLKPRLIVSSHIGLIKDKIEKRFQHYLNMIFVKEDLIFQELKVPHTLQELAVKQIYYTPRRKLSPIRAYYEKVAVDKHLERLLASGAIKEENGIYFQA